MQAGRQGIGDWRAKAALGLVALALLMRLLVPAGWMPSAAGGYAITLCTGMGAVTAWVDADGTIHQGQPGDAAPDQLCAFAGFAAALDLAAPAILVIAPALIGATPTTIARAVAIGQGLAAPPPPPTGPPAPR